MRITTACEALKKEIYSAIMDMHSNTGYSRYSVNESKIKSLIESRLRDGFVYYDGKCIMIGYAYNPWFSDEIHAGDILLYTKKEHRGQGCAAKAVTAFMKWADEIGSKSTTISQSTGVNNKEFSSLANGLGLTKTGEVYNV